MVLLALRITAFCLRVKVAGWLVSNWGSHWRPGKWWKRWRDQKMGRSRGEGRKANFIHRRHLPLGYSPLQENLLVFFLLFFCCPSLISLIWILCLDLRSFLWWFNNITAAPRWRSRRGYEKREYIGKENCRYLNDILKRFTQGDQRIRWTCSTEHGWSLFCIERVKGKGTLRNSDGCCCICTLPRLPWIHVEESYYFIFFPLPLLVIYSLWQGINLNNKLPSSTCT